MSQAPPEPEGEKGMSDDPMLQSHRRTYHSFVHLVGWSTLGVVVTLALLAIFLL